MRKLVYTFIVFFLLASQVFAADLIASKNSDKYHNQDCKLALKIKQENMIRFKTAEEAAQAGLVPCKKCNPPAAQNQLISNRKGPSFTGP